MIFFERYEILFDKFNRSYIISVGVFIPFFSVALSVFLYNLSDSSFSVFTHYLSHLGIGPNGSNIVFNAGSIIAGIVMMFFFFNLSVFLIKKEVPRILVSLSCIAGFISSLGNILIGLFPSDGSQALHNVVASFFFLGGLAYCILYGISEWNAKDISKLQALSGFVVAFFFVVFVSLTYLSFYIPELLRLSHFSEWILFILLMFWIIGHEVVMIKNKKLT
ncbi:MAG: DUF998 domain-containing protein [Promethearchaeota archaeon]